MLEKPSISDELINHMLLNGYGLLVQAIHFLPLGADQNTAVYKAVTMDHQAYFVKLRFGDFNRASVTIPRYLNDEGRKQIIPPISMLNSSLWMEEENFTLHVYPFIEGHHGYHTKLTEYQWGEFGQTIKQIHSINLNTLIKTMVPKEEYSTAFGESLRKVLENINSYSREDDLWQETVKFLVEKKTVIVELVQRSETLAKALQKNPPEMVLCHGDIHGWNLLIGQDGELYLVDWDTLVLAPKERDLMFIGAGLGESGYSSEEEAKLFYDGYGQTGINQFAIAYYRYARIVEDIAVFCDQIFSSNENLEDQKQAILYLKSNFLPGETIDTAYSADMTH
jgi:spectinomycin phosphotransferase